MAHPKCGAKARTGSLCKHPAGFGTDHVGFGKCKFHGGCVASGRKAAQREQAEQAVATYGLPREVDPHTALMEELHRTAGHVAWLHAAIGQLEEENVAGAVNDADHPRYEPNVLIRLYQDERQQLARVAKTCVDVGIEERRVKIAEQQGALFAQVLRAALGELGVPDTPETWTVVRRHLALVSGAA